ncbi:MAG: GlsB/YeaQ/YmgE family stress response membrane protein [Gemmatimonadales bacterium]
MIGLVAGVLAKLVMPGKDPGGIIITMLLGIAGSVVANFLGSLVGFYQQGERAGLLASVVGAVLILAIYRRFKKTA